MKWLRKLLFQNDVRAQKLKVESPNSAPRALAEGKQRRPDIGIELLTIRLEHLIALVSRWPLNDKDLQDWDRVAEQAKADKTDAMSAAVKLDVEFTITFWQILLANEIWNLQDCSLVYLTQQFDLFFVVKDDRRFEREAGLICGILISIKKWSDWSSDEPIKLEDCQDILEMVEILPPTEDDHILALLGFIVNHTVTIPSFQHKIEDRPFWERLIPLLERSAKSSGDEANVDAAHMARAVLEWNWNLQSQVIQLSSNSSVSIEYFQLHDKKQF